MLDLKNLRIGIVIHNVAFIYWYPVLYSNGIFSGFELNLHVSCIVHLIAVVQLLKYRGGCEITE